MIWDRESESDAATEILSADPRGYHRARQTVIGRHKWGNWGPWPTDTLDAIESWVISGGVAIPGRHLIAGRYVYLLTTADRSFTYLLDEAEFQTRLRS